MTASPQARRSSTRTFTSSRGDRATLPIRAAAFVGSIAGFSLHPDGKSFLRPGVVSLFDGQIGECEQQREFVRRDEFAQDAQVLLPHVPPPSPSR